MSNQLVIFLQENFIKYYNEEDLCVSHSDINQQQDNFSHISAFLPPKKGTETYLRSNWTLEHSIKEQVSEAHIKNSRLQRRASN